MTPASSSPSGIQILHAPHPAQDRVLTPAALEFVVDLQRRFNPRRLELLAARAERQKRLDAGEKPDFLKATRAIRESEWRVAPIPEDLLDRRVEITGPVDRKMIINALNSGAKVFMADFEDSNTPTWANQMEGQSNLTRCSAAQHHLHRPGHGKNYKLNERDRDFVCPAARLAPGRATRSGGWQADVRVALRFRSLLLSQREELLAREPGRISICPSWRAIWKRACGTTFSFLPRNELGIPRGTDRATVLIETILAAFEMDEILYELREHSAGLNCGRWDYIFSFIKKFANDPNSVLPDRAQVTMTTHFLRTSASC